MRMTRTVQLAEAADQLSPSDYDEPFVIPTETVYGLAARIDREEALRKIFQIKGRPSDNPLIVHVSSMDMLRTVVDGDIPQEYRLLIDNFWPGPLSLVFRASSAVSPTIRGSGRETVAVRMPASRHLLRLIDRIGVPLAAPSANTSGRPSPTTVAHARADLGDRVGLYIDGGATEMGLESTVFGIFDAVPVLLRPGSVTRESIELVIGRPVQVKTVSGRDQATLSPGQKYTHYSPSIPVFLFRGQSAGGQGADDWAVAMRRKQGELGGSRIGVVCSSDDNNQLAVHKKIILGTDKRNWCRNIFSALLELEKTCDVIFVHSVDSSEEGLAIMDRIEKAATHTV